ncbi:MAG: ABC transporter permease [Anaerolineae bacterium]|jgi:ABC-2 type transport system permease protein|nr:ABC transporter permease [Anaerolineae bacterium]
MLIVTGKEIQVLVRERGALAVLFLLPLLVGSLYGTMQTQMARDSEANPIFLTVALANLDAGTFGVELSKALHGISILEVVEPETPEEAEAIVAEGRATAAIVIPADFTAQVDAYEPTQITVILDPADPQRAEIVNGIMKAAVSEVTIWGEVQYGVRTVLRDSGLLDDADPEAQRAAAAQSLGVIMTRINELRSDPPIRVSSEDLQGATVEGGITVFLAHMFPGITVMFVFFVVGVAGESLLHEREVGTLRRLLASPIPKAAVIAGKVLAFTLLVCLQVVVLFGTANIAFRMPLGRAPLALILLTVILGLVASALGMLVASFSKSAKQADSAGMILSFVLAGLGGAIAISQFPLARSGGPMATVAQLTPHAHAIEAYYRLMAEKGTLVDILPQLAVLLGMALLFGAIAARRFRFE